MNAMRQDAQKQSRKFCRSKQGENSETHPIQPEKGETGCVPGAGEGCSGWRRMKPGEKTRKARRKSRDGLVSAAASVGAGRSPQATSAPRHALRGAQPCLVAKTFRSMTKNSATAKAVALFLAGAEGLSLAGRLGRFAAERHWRSLTPRHAVLEWMWKNASERGEGAVLPVFFCKTKTCGAGLVLFGSPVPKHALKVHWKSLSE